MKGRICLAGLLTVISSLSLAGSDIRGAPTHTSSVTSPLTPAMSEGPGLTLETRTRTGTGISAVLTRIISGDGMLDSLWSQSRAPQRPADIAKP
jgi:hypothetical protein